MALSIGESTAERQLKLRLKAWADANDAVIAAIVGLTDGDKGDITVSASGATWTIDGNAVTAAKIADANVTDAKLRNSVARSIIGRSANSTGAPADIQSGGNGRILAELSSALAFQTLTSLIDVLGATQGNVLYRDGSGWVVLAPGTAGYALLTGGAGANPSYGRMPKWTRHAVVGTTTGTTASTTGIPACSAIMLALNGVSHNSGSNQSVRVALSSDNGSNYGTARNITAAVAGSVAQHGQVWIMEVGTAGSNKDISPNTGASGAASTYRNLVIESTTTGVTNALQFSPSGGSFDAGGIVVYYA